MNNKLIAIVGETASGKSGLAMQLAKKFDGEIIAADSRTIYKGMDIGTAKPSQQDQLEVPHHLLDVVSPDQKFSVADFQKLAKQAIADIQGRKKLPFLVGGSGLYINSVVFDYNFGSVPNKAKRDRLNALNLDQLGEMAKKLDENISKNTLSNKRHLVRLIESKGAVQQQDKLIENCLILGLKLPRTELRKRIEARVEVMFRAGIRKEVEELAEQYGWESEAMTGIVYKLFKKHYQNELSITQVKRKFVQEDLKLAKKQRTWFKKNRYIHWLDNVGDAEQIVEQFINK